MSMRITLAARDLLFRQGVRALLERHGYEVVAEASSGLQAVEVARKCRPDVAVLERLLPQLNGLDAARQIRSVSPATGVILLASAGEDDFVLDAFRDGVRAFVLKTQPVEDLLRAIREVSCGGIYVGAALSNTFLETLRGGQRMTRELLSPRERQVLQLVAEGNSTKQVAALLSISIKTAEYHRTRLMKKLNIHGSVGLTRYAIRHGLTAP
ncbi:MAG: LuxR C-terminal-related transcriptional regulator [bacterium]